MSVLLLGNNSTSIITWFGNMPTVSSARDYSRRQLTCSHADVSVEGITSPPGFEPISGQCWAAKTISDNALGTHIRINPAAQEMVPVIVNGFQFDHTATLSVDNGGTPTITPDGHGGSIATFAHVAVDFIGDSNLRMSQLSGGPPPSA